MTAVLFILVAIAATWVFIVFNKKQKTKKAFDKAINSHRQIVEVLKAYEKLIEKGAKYGMPLSGRLKEILLEHGISVVDEFRTLDGYNSYIQQFNNLKPELEKVAQLLRIQINDVEEITKFVTSSFNKPTFLQNRAISQLEKIPTFINNSLEQDFEQKYQDTLMGYMSAFKTLNMTIENNNFPKLGTDAQSVLGLRKSIESYFETANKTITENARLEAEAKRARQSVIDSIERLRKLSQQNGVSEATREEITLKTNVAVNRLQEFDTDLLMNLNLAKDIMKGWDLLERKISEEVRLVRDRTLMVQRQQAEMQRKIAQQNFDRQRRKEERERPVYEEEIIEEEQDQDLVDIVSNVATGVIVMEIIEDVFDNDDDIDYDDDNNWEE